MQSAVSALQSAANESKGALDEIERTIVRRMPEAGELLELCRRLRGAKSRLIALNAKVQLLTQAQEAFDRALSENLLPAAKILERACEERDISKPKVEFLRELDEQEPASGNPKQRTLITAGAKGSGKKQAPARMGTQRKHVAEPDFVDITEDEYATIDSKTYGHISYSDIRNLYKVLWDFAQESEPGKVITKREIVELGVKIKLLQSALRFLKSLKRIELTKDGNVKTVL